jgi:hypothetical protein
MESSEPDGKDNLLTIIFLTSEMRASRAAASLCGFSLNCASSASSCFFSSFWSGRKHQEGR